MSQPDEFLNRFNEAPLPEPDEPTYLVAMLEAERRAWLLRAERLLCAAPASRPAMTLGGSPCLTSETPEPAGLVGIAR